MNKNRIFLTSMLLVTALLFLLRLTGLIPHIIVSVIGLAIMIPLTIKTKSDWKIPALEIIMRAIYFVAIVSGGMLIKLHGIAVLGMAHKISAAIFLLLLLVLYVPKWKK